jgi:RNA polymerase sigma-70 factor (ECF subfamily)
MALAHDTLEELNQRYRTPLFAYFRRRVARRADAEDLTQDVFVRLLRAQPEKLGKSADFFVFRVASNLLRDHIRRKVVRQIVCEADIDELPVHADVFEALEPERVLLGKEALETATDALSELPRRTVEIFMLFRFDQMKHREIAELYGLSASSVEKEIAKAMRALTSAINAQEADRK